MRAYWDDDSRAVSDSYLIHIPALPEVVQVVPTSAKQKKKIKDWLQFSVDSLESPF